MVEGKARCHVGVLASIGRSGLVAVVTVHRTGVVEGAQSRSGWRRCSRTGSLVEYLGSREWQRWEGGQRHVREGVSAGSQSMLVRATRRAWRGGPFGFGRRSAGQRRREAVWQPGSNMCVSHALQRRQAGQVLLGPKQTKTDGECSLV